MHEQASIDALLTNATWVQALARQMLGDAGLGDDAAQETWMAALRGAPQAGSERPWLTRVLRNFVRQRQRSESARTQREQRVARPERLPSSDETVARAELHGKLVRAVLALDEPYRTTILWRYFEELSNEEIARRAGIDPRAVRSRTARARERLREQLTSETGEPPEHWIAALLPLGWRPVGCEPSVATGALGGVGGVLMGMKLIVGVAAATAAAIAILWWTTRSSEPARLAAAEPAFAGQSESIAVPEATLPAGSEHTDARAAVAAIEASAGTAATPSILLRGIVLSEDGRVPLAGARIALRRGREDLDFVESAEALLARTTPVTASDALGRFELPAPSDPDAGLWIEADGHFPWKLSAGDLPRDPSATVEAVLAPLGRIELTLLDEASAPRADLAVRYSIDVTRGSQDFMWSYRREFLGGRSDPEGRLTIASVPCGMPIDLRYGENLFSANFLGIVTIDPRERVRHHTVRIASTASIVGRFVRADGEPAQGLRVEWQSYPLDYDDPVRAITDADGAFALRDLKPASGQLELAIAGFEPPRLQLKSGETLDVGTLAVPELFALSGRVTSELCGFETSAVHRSGAMLGTSSGIEARAFRDGRVIAELRLRDGAFETAVTGGPLEVLVTRGGYWHAGIGAPREMLARVALEHPATGLEISLDARNGAIDVELGERAPPQGEVVSATAFAVASDGALSSVASASASPDAAGRVRIGPLAPGRYRVTATNAHIGHATSLELTVVAGQATSSGELVFGGGVLAGRVVDGAGKPVAQAHLRVRDDDGEREAATDEGGRFRIDGLAPDLYRVDVQHGDHGSTRIEDVVVLSGTPAELTVVLSGHARVVGRVHSAGVPVAGLVIGAQPPSSNDSYSAVTDAQGSFTLERLPSGRLRLWSSGKFMHVLDLAGGETRELDLEVNPPRVVRFLRDGEPIGDLNSAQAIAFDARALAQRAWTLGRPAGGGVELDVPAGRVLFDVHRARSGANESYLALADRAALEVELCTHAITLDTAGPWNGPLPRATLLDIEGHEVLNIWAGKIVLAVERDADGRVRVPCLPAKARVKLTGFDSRGACFETTVDVGAVSSVRWP